MRTRIKYSICLRWPLMIFMSSASFLKNIRLTFLTFAALFVFSQNVFAQPSITTFSPTSGPVGTAVTINGSGFNATFSNNIVFFGNAKATVTGGNTTVLNVTVPAGATYKPISVLNSSTGNFGYSAKPFDVTFPCPDIINPNSMGTNVNFTTGTNPMGIALGDLDLDSKPDVVIANYNSGTISVIRNTSTAGSINAGSFAPKVDFAAGTNPHWVTIGDLDGDGKPEIVLVSQFSNAVSVYRNTSTPGSITGASFAAKVDFATGTEPLGVAIADIDKNGKPELIVANSVSNTISVFKNTSTAGSITVGSFAAKVDFATGAGPRSVAVGDIDGDGKVDIATANAGTTTTSVFRNTSTSGSITVGSLAAKVDFTVGTAPYTVALSDLDRDGKLDLGIVNSTSNTVSILLNTASSGSITAGSFAAKVDFATGTQPYDITFENMDGDNKPDIVILSRGSTEVDVFSNTSTPGVINAGSFAPYAILNSGAGPRTIASGDVDGDGRPEVVAGIYSGNVVSVYQNLVYGPSILSTTPGSRCSTGVVTLSATAASGIINWYAAATGGSSLGTGNSFSTPSISTTTTYYVDATNGGCTTTTRTAIIATINPLPVANAGVDANMCSGGTATIGGSPTASGGTPGYTYSWTFGAGTTSNPSVSPGTTTNYTVTVTDANSCVGTDAILITVVSATANAGADQTVCASSPTVVLNGSVGGAATGGSWSGGAGTFSPNASTLNATYTPTAGEISGGSVNLTLVSTGPCAAAVDNMLITISATPTFTVTNTNNAGAGSLRQAILDANAAACSSVISVTTTGTVTLASSLPAITKSITINGNGLTVSGNNLYSIFIVNNVTVTIDDLIVANAFAKGGNGQSPPAPFQGAGGGGGGGLGGGIFVYGAIANVTVSNITFSGNKAVGGDGGNGIFTGGQTTGTGGAGGVGNQSLLAGTAGAGGAIGAVGGNGGVLAGGGGAGHTSTPSANGGTGGLYGGGGGKGINTNGTGSSAITGAGGTFGGAGGTSNGGSTPNGGGGGAGLGGAIFVHSGQITITNVQFLNNRATGGNGGSLASKGLGKGSCVFITSGATVNYSGSITFDGNIASGDACTIYDNDAIYNGNGSGTYYFPAQANYQLSSPGGNTKNNINLIWTPCYTPATTSYTLERSVGNNSSYALLATLPGTQTTYSDATVSPNTFYYYRIKGLNADGTSGEYTEKMFNTYYPPGSGSAINASSTGYVLIDNAIPLAASYTLESWFVAPLPAIAQNTLFRGSNSDAQIKVETNLLGVNSANTTFYSSGFNMTTLTAGWHHIAAVATGGSTTFYIDGISVGTAAFQSTSDIYNLGNSTSGTRPFGIFDEVRVWNGARTIAQIRDNMCKKLQTASETNLVAYLPFDENTGTLLENRAANYINDASLTGAISWQTYSGAAIGDVSANLYTAGTSISLTDGDAFTAKNFTLAAAKGVHVYKVREAPNNITVPGGLSSLESSRYFGTFLVGGVASIDIEYDYTNNGNLTNKGYGLLSRTDNSAGAFLNNVSATQNGAAKTLSKAALTVRSEYITAVYPSTCVVINTNDAGAGSLRQCITSTNSLYGRDTIIFGLSAGGPYTINLASTLPSLTDAMGVVIDGFTQTGASVNTIPVFNATSSTPLNTIYKIILGNSASIPTGIVLTSDNNIVKGLVLQNFGDGTPSSNDIAITINGNSNSVLGCTIGLDVNGTTKGAKQAIGIQISGANNNIGNGTAAGANLISGMNGSLYGVNITGATATGNIVQGNMIGLQKDGSTIVAGATQLFGVCMQSLAASNTIGGDATAGYGNVISGNYRDGINFQGSGDNNTILGNYLGVAANGMQAVANNHQQNGIEFTGAGQNTIVGGNTASLRNVLSGNTEGGISFDGNDPAIIKGNYIGIAADGSSLVTGNAQSYGVFILDHYSNDTIRIGGSASGEGNVISGNIVAGIHSQDAYSVKVLGNIIGCKSDGISNITSNPQTDGINLNGESWVIGGNTSGQRNIISGNLHAGINYIGNGSAGFATGSIIKGNYIGAGATLSVITGATQSYGIYAQQTYNLIVGSTAVGEGNVISQNTLNGIYLNDLASVNDIISGNKIYSNTGKPININYGASQANNGKTMPTITSTCLNTIAGTSGANDIIEIFKNTTGNVYDATTLVGTTTANGSGSWSYGATLSTSDYVIANARDASNNTSEFCAFAVSGGAGTWVWLGLTTDWFDACNWDKKCLPDASSDVSIPGGTPNNPTITGATANCKTININTTNGGHLSIITTASGHLNVAQ